MKIRTITTGFLALALLLPLAACSRQSGPDGDNGKARAAQQDDGDSMIAAHIRESIREAKQELENENIDVSAVHAGDDRDADRRNLPKAEITPQGELLIGGEKVKATPAQRALLLDYRHRIVDIAEAGMDIGIHGASLGVNAAREALWGAFTGKSDEEIEAALKPQTDKIKAAAMRLCRKHLPGLLASQRKLAAAMPEFRPYASMTQEDIDDCGRDTADGDDAGGIAILSD